MSLYSPWYSIACMMCLLTLVHMPVFDVTVDPRSLDRERRVRPLDGLRGFLALSVFFHHASVYHGFIENGRWALPPSMFYAKLGQFGVAMFFMITGFLFWQKLIFERGRPNWVLLYLGRVFRIGPLYVAAISVMILVVLARSGWAIRGTVFGLVKSCAWWLNLGILGPGPDINHLPDVWHLTAGATWTLQYEWYFYAALLPMAVTARHRRNAIWFALSALVVSSFLALRVPTDVATFPASICMMLFAIGMIGATIEPVQIDRVPRRLVSGFVLLLLVVAFVAFSSFGNVLAILVLGAAFVPISAGCDLFGVLSTKGALRLGTVSYGLYLLHGLVLDLTFSSISVRAFAMGSPLGFWAIILVCAISLTFCSLLGFVVFERPGIALGRHFGKRLGGSAVATRRQRFLPG